MLRFSAKARMVVPLAPAAAMAFVAMEIGGGWWRMVVVAAAGDYGDDCGSGGRRRVWVVKRGDVVVNKRVLGAERGDEGHVAA
jgi:hypothetical protein